MTIYSVSLFIAQNMEHIIDMSICSEMMMKNDVFIKEKLIDYMIQFVLRLNIKHKLCSQSHDWTNTIENKIDLIILTVMFRVITKIK